MIRRYAMPPLMLAMSLAPSVGRAEPTPTLTLQYSTFFSQMKTFAKGEFGHARLGFYLTDPQHGQRCGLTFARVATDSKEVAGEVTVDSELRLPFDEDLNLDKGVVTVGLQEEHVTCDMTVQVMADAPAGGDMPLTELVARQQQMQQLLDKMAGMVGKYFLPDMVGVRIAMIAPEGRAYLVEGARQIPIDWQAGQLQISAQQLADFATGTLRVPGEPLRVTPWLRKD
ncbi:DUF2987 domain-containing protein [Aeromonas cavernicola]|uniref:DUF2987 domain-containing protein n=1 Tax=Aeromonas cavernicola TaxID=1006623 RepID=A0A2H9U5G5_9GAMM|nr:DUF2987 domain-containing protein [Aeromonas cavernicola]PJG59229.1 DUF2987 domain-containing protein [Aeromonas cavernicola]